MQKKENNLMYYTAQPEFLKTSHLSSKGISSLIRASAQQTSRVRPYFKEVVIVLYSDVVKERSTKMERWKATLLCSSQEENTTAELYKLTTV